MVVGHEEPGEAGNFLDSTGIPSAGRVVGLHNDFVDEPCLVCNGANSAACKFCDGTGKLYTQYADVADMPETIAKLVNGRAYNACSAEVYEDFEHAGQHYGKTFRRLALLGGELPQIKTLADLPMADYSERPARRATLHHKKIRRREAAGSYLVFSEVRPMTTATAIPPAKKKRLKPAKFSDKVKATLKKFSDETTMPDTADMADGKPAPAPAGVSRDDMIQLLQEAGFDPAILDGMADPQLAEIIRVYKTQMAQQQPDANAEPCPKMGEPPHTPPPANPPSPAPTANSEPPLASPNPSVQAHPGAPKKTTVTHQYSDDKTKVVVKHGEKEVTVDAKTYEALQLLVKPITDQLGAAQQDVAKFHEAEKKKSIDARIDVLIKQGKVLPAEVDAGLKDQLYRADGIAKFSDGKTELDKQLAILEARPQIVKFNEIGKTGSSGTAGSATSEDAEIAQVEQHYEQFADTFRKIKTTKKDMVDAYKAKAKREPGLTAKAFLRI